MKQTIIVLLLLLSASCYSQEAEIDITKLLKTPTFTSPDIEKPGKLKIPYRQDGLYGICSYDFEIILPPQFEDIEAPDPLFNCFKAKKNGKWSIYDYTGNKILPIETTEKHKIDQKIIFIGDDVSKRPDLNLYISKIKDPVSYFFMFSTSAVKELPKYYYCSKKSSAPLKAWFEPDYEGMFRRDEYYNTKFTNSFQYGYIKVMDEHQQFTLLDQDGNAIFEPVLNCAAVSPTKILLLNADGKCAVKDITSGWTTDYRFTDVKKTVNPNILIGQVTGKDVDVNYYLIDSLGDVTTLSALDDYVPLNSEFSRVKSTNPEDNNSFILYNEWTKKKERNLPDYELNYTLNEIGFSIKRGNKIIGVETLEGDTILSPDYDSFSFINDSTYYFKQAIKQGFVNKDGSVLYEVSDAQLRYYSTEYYKVKANKKHGLVRTNGDEIFLPIYNLLFHQPDVDRAIARVDNKYGYYEWSTGKELVPIGLDYLANTRLPYQSGACVELKVNRDRYIANSNLEIRYQSAKVPIIDKSNFRIGDAAAEVQEDFKKSKLPKSIS